MQNRRTVFMHSKPKTNLKKSRTTVAGIIDMDAKEIRIHGARNNTSVGDVFNRKIGRTVAEGRAEKHPFKVIKLNNTKDKKKIMQKFINAANEIFEKPYKLTQQDK